MNKLSGKGMEGSKVESMEGEEIKAAAEGGEKIFPNFAFKNDPNGFNLIQILVDSMCRKCYRWLSLAAGMAWKANSSCGCLNRLFTAKIPTVPSHCHETVLVPLFETSIWAFQMPDLCMVENRRVLDSSIPVIEEQPRQCLDS